MVAELPLRTLSVNVREHWAKRAERRREERAMARMALGAVEVPEPPFGVVLTRIGKKRLDSDNLAGSFKSVRDGIADWAGIDDGLEDLVWYEYEQETGAEYGVRIELVVR